MVEAPTRLRSPWTIIVLLLSLALIVASCGGEYDDEDAFARTRSLINVIEQDRALSTEWDIEAELTSDQKRCLIGKEVDIAGLVDTEDQQAAVPFFRALLDCVPRLDDVEGLVGSVVTGLAASFPGDMRISMDEGRCLIGAVLDDSNDPARLLAGLNDTGDADVWPAAMSECLSEENFAIVMGEQGPERYGDDDRLDDMYDECEAGDARVCDLLARHAVEGSEYFDLAIECAGREPSTATSCSVDGEVNLVTGFADPAGAGLRTLGDDCQGGDNTACDLLYSIAPIGSGYEQIGFTCGGRIAVGAIPDCRTRLG